jgi:hypothetical protein
MQSKLAEIKYDIELQPGEVLSLPQGMEAIVGPGHWVVSIKPADGAVRDHTAFLNSYEPEDEGLYDDYSAG